MKRRCCRLSDEVLMHKTEGDRKVIEWMTPAPFSSMLSRFLKKKKTFFYILLGSPDPGLIPFCIFSGKLFQVFGLGPLFDEKDVLGSVRYRPLQQLWLAAWWFSFWY